MDPKRCGIHSEPQSLLQKTCISYASETLDAYAGMCLHTHALAHVRRPRPTYVGRDPRMQVKGHFGHFISKNRFLLI